MMAQVRQNIPDLYTYVGVDQVIRDAVNESLVRCLASPDAEQMHEPQAPFYI